MYFKDAITELAKLAKREHYACDDSFYSCPNEKNRKNECTCGADEHNKKVDEIINSISFEKS